MSCSETREYNDVLKNRLIIFLYYNVGLSIYLFPYPRRKAECLLLYRHSAALLDIIFCSLLCGLQYGFKYVSMRHRAMVLCGLSFCLTRFCTTLQIKNPPSDTPVIAAYPLSKQSVSWPPLLSWHRPRARIIFQNRLLRACHR